MEHIPTGKKKKYYQMGSTYSAPPNLAVEVYSRDLVLKRGTKGQAGYEPAPIERTWGDKPKKKRGTIKAFTWKSKKRGAFTLRNAQAGRHEAKKRPLRNVVDLTYPREYPHSGPEIKAHLHRFLNWVRARGGSYFAVLEFQSERGKHGYGSAPHFHVLTNIYIEKNTLARKWYEIVASGDERHLSAGTRVSAVHNLARFSTYLVQKYLLKAEQKDVPEDFENVGRFWFYSSDLLEVERLFTANYAMTGSQEVVRIQNAQRDSYIRTLRRWYRAHCRGWPDYMRPKHLGKRLNSLGKVFRNGKAFHDEYMRRFNTQYLFQKAA